jgi:hypothetical protein
MPAATSETPPPSAAAIDTRRHWTKTIWDPDMDDLLTRLAGRHLSDHAIAGALSEAIGHEVSTGATRRRRLALNVRKPPRGLGHPLAGAPR